MSHPIDTVFVVDDDASVREAMGSLFRSIGLRVELFPSAHSFLQRPRPEAPSCLILDVRMPGLGGLECQRQLADAGLRIPVIFMTGHGDIPMSVRAMKAGAVDFLTKPFRDQDLLDAVQLALARDRTRRADEQALSVLRDRLATLTSREQEVMARVISGRLNKQIAGEMGTQRDHGQGYIAATSCGTWRRNRWPISSGWPAGSASRRGRERRRWGRDARRVRAVRIGWSLALNPGAAPGAEPQGGNAVTQEHYIAVVDDDQSVREGATNLFRSMGLTVVAFSSAEEFLRSDGVDRASCLVLDVQMPGMSGLELQSHLAAIGRRIPIVFVTAFSDERARNAALTSGAVCFLTKPFNEEEMLGLNSAISTNSG